MSDIHAEITDLEDICESICCDRVADLQHLAQTLHTRDAGIVLWGSGADPQSFTLSSDFDVGILSKDSDTAGAVSEDLARRWNELTGNMPELHIAIFPEEAWADPYWRVSVWLSHPNHPLRSNLFNALNTHECRREHLLEALCESLSSQRVFQRKNPINLRTHPHGLRAVWHIKFLSTRGFADAPQHHRGWMSALLHGYGLPDTDIQAAVRLTQYLRFVRSLSPKDTMNPLHILGDAHVREKWWQLSLALKEEITGIMQTGTSPLHDAFTATCHVQAQQLEIDIERMLSVLTVNQEEKIAVCGENSDAVVALAWCERSEAVLHAIARRYAHHELISMGLAFNRNTPLSIILQLTDLPSYLRRRPLFRRRCYFHKAHKEAIPKQRRHFLRQMLTREPSPALRTALTQALQEVEE